VSEIKNSVPAFPRTVQRWNDSLENVEGMTLRDYFAAKAMQGAFTSPIASSADEKDYIAMHAYKMADAMLRAREN